MDGHGTAVHVHPSSSVNILLTYLSINSLWSITVIQEDCIVIIMSFSIYSNSQLFDQEAELDWVIFHDMMVTSRVYLRTVCPIRYDWVKDLLPKLHEVDAYELSNIAREEVNEEELAKLESKEAKRQKGILAMIVGFVCCHVV
jgi:hypothetical protein